MKKNIRDHDIEGQYRTVSNPYIAVPLTAILKKELVRKYGLFFSLSHLTGGMRTPDRGSTTGAASWTDDEPARRLPAGRAQRVNPPLTAILKKELVRKYGLFFHLKPP
ncbi:hypothetical protein AC369_16500, partial [Salmonella enterica subsp. diarizonae]|nr:hypothetical protein DOE63_09095 [Salmonella enterica subsp. diarizonae serovar 59:z10:-]EBF4784098.1 hypothetical protein [Salmonella enterica subsp. diarizonae]